jgi:hypothetical protein
MAAHRSHGNWSQALRETDINPDFYVYRKRDLDEIFPWDFIDHGISKEQLKKEYLKAMEEAGVPSTSPSPHRGEGEGAGEGGDLDNEQWTIGSGQ